MHPRRGHLYTERPQDSGSTNASPLLHSARFTWLGVFIVHLPRSFVHHHVSLVPAVSKPCPYEAHLLRIFPVHNVPLLPRSMSNSLPRASSVPVAISQSPTLFRFLFDLPFLAPAATSLAHYLAPLEGEVCRAAGSRGRLHH